MPKNINKSEKAENNLKTHTQGAKFFKKCLTFFLLQSRLEKG